MPEYSGTVYLIHFQTKLAHAMHYIGYTSDVNVDARVAKHRKGHGARLLAEANRRNIRWHVARVWFDVSRKFERRLKNLGGARQICPVCSLTAFRRGSRCQKPARVAK